MNRPHSHRNLLWSGHWPVVFHKQTGTLLYSLFVSWSFYWQSNGRVDGFTMCTLSDAYVLPFWYKHIKEVPTVMAVSFMTLWSLWAFLLLVQFLKSAFVRQAKVVFRREHRTIC